MQFDISYPGFRDELVILGKVDSSLLNYFLSLVANGTVVAAANCRVIEVAFDSSYEIWKLSYNGGKLAVLARVQNSIVGFTSIVKPLLPFV